MTDLQLKIFKLIEDGCENSDIAEELNCSPRHVRRMRAKFNELMIEDGFVDLEHAEFTSKEEINGHLKSLSRRYQKVLDANRIERKVRREQYRSENAIGDYLKSLVSVLDGRYGKEVQVHEDQNNEYFGIIHLSDLHFNELVDLPNNKYDFKIASKRLHKLANNAIKIFRAYDITSILIAGTGDFLNSDRRRDEMLSMATNRAKATALAAIVLEQFIKYLSSHFNISVSYVAGNESRVNDEFGSTEMVMSDNYDVNIMEILRVMFRGTGVEFIESDVSETVINVNGHNILLIHGHQIPKTHILRKVQEIKAKYSDEGINISFVLFGHFHEALNADLYSRSSSLVGANAYSDNQLQLSSKSSQNIHIIGKNEINSMKIDLQNTDGFSGFEIDSELEAYNAKSVSKMNKPRNFYVVGEIR